jgi:hypothetical protein
MPPLDFLLRTRCHSLTLASTYHNLGNRIVVVGASSHVSCYTDTESRAGVIGLTTALVLRRDGYENITIATRPMRVLISLHIREERSWVEARTRPGIRQ